MSVSFCDGLVVCPTGNSIDFKIRLPHKEREKEDREGRERQKGEEKAGGQMGKERKVFNGEDGDRSVVERGEDTGLEAL